MPVASDALGSSELSPDPFMSFIWTAYHCYACFGLVGKTSVSKLELRVPLDSQHLYLTVA